MISVSGSGEVSAYYEMGPELDISRARELRDSIFTDSPITLKVKVTSNREPVINADVTFYIGSESIGPNETDSEGCASISFALDEEKIYTWHVKAKKRGYVTTSSDEWEFAFQRVKLYTPDEELFMDFPINLVALVELDGEPFEGAKVSYFIDGNYTGYRKTQPNGFTTYSIQDITVGRHTWYVTVKIPWWTLITSETYSFTYLPEVSVHLEYPKDKEVIAEFTSTIKLRAFVGSDGVPFQGGNVSFFVMGQHVGSNVTDADGLASFDFSPPMEDKDYTWYVTVSEEGYFNDTSPTWSFYYPAQPPYVEVDEVFTSAGRADVNGEQTIGFHLRWENGSDVIGAAIRTADDQEGITDDSGWIHFTVTSSYVGEEVLRIEEVSCTGMGEFRHNSRYPTIIWDRVSITLSVEDNRIDVGSVILPKVEAFYEYDGADFNGSISYGTELYSDVVCEKRIKVNGIQDYEYGLSAFRSNDIDVIWDRVRLSLDIIQERVEVGSEAKITYEGLYEYDQKPLKGSVTFDDNLRQYDLGEKEFGVLNISDSLYNLSAFSSNKISCIFDEIEIEQQINMVIPTQIQILTDIHYKFDGEPVDDARVDVNGIGERIGAGKYRTTLYTFYPSLKMDTEIKLPGWETMFIEKKKLAIGNIIVEMASLVLLSTITMREIQHAFKRSKIRHEYWNEFWGRVINELKDEQLIRNWTVRSGYLGRADFIAIYRGGDYIECRASNDGHPKKVPKRDLKIMYDHWKNYIEKRIGRKQLRDISRFTKYTISIIHQYEKLTYEKLRSRDPRT